MKITGISFLAAVILAGSTGISLFVHACGSGKKLDYSFYPEYFSVGKSCCDPWAGKTMSSCNSESHRHARGISKIDCCQSLHVILRVAQLLQPFNNNIDLSVSGQYANVVFKTSLPEIDKSTGITGFLAGDPSPPPRSGKTLVISLHQIRIPS